MPARLFAAISLSLLLAACGDSPVDPSDDALALAADGTAATRPQGGTLTIRVTATREGGYAGAVTFAVGGAPAGVTATVANVTSSGGHTSADLTLLVGAATPAGTHPLTLVASGEGIPDATAAFALTVTGPSGVTTVSFADCAPTGKPLWFAWQNGDGAWTPLQPVNDRYAFAVTASRAGYAWVNPVAGSSYALRVRYATGAELAQRTVAICEPGAGTYRVWHGDIVGLAPTEFASIVSGASGTTISGIRSDFELGLIAPGPGDLLAFRYPSSNGAAPSRGVIRRDVDAIDHGTIAPLDFAGPESFVPATAQWNVINPLGTSGAFLQLASDTRCKPAPLPVVGGTLYGLSTATRRAGDLHILDVNEQQGDRSRSVKETYRVFGHRSILFGAPLATPQVTFPGGAYQRLQASFTIPPDYLRSAILLLVTGEAPGRYAEVTASYGWLGGATATLAVPDLSGVAGWSAAWLPAPAPGAAWALTVVGGSFETDHCREGTLSRYATVQGG